MTNSSRILVSMTSLHAGKSGRVYLRLLRGAAFVLATTATAQQSSMPVGLPARPPGYEHYFRSEQPSTAFATRWGYFDGYQDGKHDRLVGKPPAPSEQDRYKLVPDHGIHPDLPRAKYKVLYREAYMFGYQYGSKE